MPEKARRLGKEGRTKLKTFFYCYGFLRIKIHPHHDELINNFYSWKREKGGEKEVLFGWTLGNVVNFDPLTTVKSGSDSCYLFEKAALSGISSYVCGRIG